MKLATAVIVSLALLPACAAHSAGSSGGVVTSATPEEVPVELATTGGVLHGTLLLPVGPGERSPVALIIAGSGPTDRNGNSPAIPGQNNSLKLLAEGLAQRGIATLRYDKRGIAASAAAGPREVDLRFDTYSDDAAAWIDQLRSDPRFSSVSIVGHSEGSLVGIRAAQEEEIDAFVSIAGPGRPAAEVLREQLRPQLPPNLWTESERILTALLSGQTASQVPTELEALYRASVQPYLISWLRLDPAAELGRVEAPVLIIQGTTDIQVGVADAQGLKAGRPDAEMALIDGMNHVLKPVPADMAQQQASYSNPDLPLAPGLVDRIATFLLANR